MAQDSPGPITELLGRVNNGDPEAADDLYAIVYDELHAIANRHLVGRRAGGVLQPTMIVNEAYIRLADRQNLGLKNSGHFFGVLSKAMRSVVVEHARRARTLKRGGGWARVPLTGLSDKRDFVDLDGLDLDEALLALGAARPQVERIITLRIFAGLTLDQLADVFEVSVNIVRRDWDYGVAWLYNRLKDKK